MKIVACTKILKNVHEQVIDLHLIVARLKNFKQQFPLSKNKKEIKNHKIILLDAIKRKKEKNK